MSHPSKAKGSRWEAQVRDYFRAFFGWAERIPAGATLDRGDVTLAGVPVCIEAKNAQRMELAQWVDEAVVEARHAGARWPVVIAHRKGRGQVADGYAIMRVADFADLLAEAVRP